MSKPVKELLRKELVRRLDGVTSLVIVDLTGVDAVSTGKIRGRLCEKDIRLTVVKNSVARQAFRDIGLESAVVLLEGPCAVARGSDSVVNIVRELLEIGREERHLSVKAAVLDGEVFGAGRIEELSKYPTRDEAISQLLGCVLSAGTNLAACLIGPPSQVAGLLKVIEERQAASHGEAVEAS